MASLGVKAADAEFVKGQQDAECLGRQAHSRKTQDSPAPTSLKTLDSNVAMGIPVAPAMPTRKPPVAGRSESRPALVNKSNNSSNSNTGASASTRVERRYQRRVRRAERRAAFWGARVAYWAARRQVGPTTLVGVLRFTIGSALVALRRL